ncbi:MAG: FAD:protein FMN transferase [Desulfatiglandales bacterium]
MEKSFSRREFLKRSVFLGLGIAGGALIPSVSEALKFDRNLYKVSRTQLLIGTVVQITAVDPSRDKADHAIGLAFEEIKRLEGILTRFATTSSVGLLNREGRLKDIPPELRVMVEESVRFHSLTHGAFDITVKPLLDLYEKRFKEGRQPSEEEITKAVDLVGTEYLKLTPQGISFAKEGMGITLDGIAKGYIVDMASDVMAKHGIQNFLINAGGDIRVKGERKEGGPWKIAIQDPEKKGHYPDVIRLREGAIATSGNYEVYYDNEMLFHHIVDPATGRSPLDLISVSVVARSTREADALSTALFVMGPKVGESFVASYGCDCLLVTRSGELIGSKGWKALRREV